MTEVPKEVWELEVGSRFDGKRVDQFLAALLTDLSRSYVQKLIDEGQAEVDGMVCRRSQRLHAGQQVRLMVPEAQASEVEAEDIPLDIVYQDSDLLLVNKPVGMVVHPNLNDRSGTLVHALLWHVKDLSGINGVERPGIVHRIDKDTSGLLLVAKNDVTHRHLSDQFREHSTDRLYVALCWGGPPSPREGTITTSIGRDPSDRKRMASVSRGKEAVTHYRVAENYGPVGMVECSLDTGRTHQIRVHLSELGHPLVGDPVYGGLQKRWLQQHPQLRDLVAPLRGQMLHAATLGFIHPSSDEYMRFRCPPPERMMRVIRHLRRTAEMEEELPGPWDRETDESFGRRLG